MDFPLVTIDGHQELDFIMNLLNGEFPYRVVSTDMTEGLYLRTGPSVIYIDEENLELGERVLNSVGHKSDRQKVKVKDPVHKKKRDALDRKVIFSFSIVLVIFFVWVILSEINRIQ